MQSLTSLREVGKVKLIGRVYSCPWFSCPVTHGLSGTPLLIQAAKTSGCVSSAVLQEAPSAGSGAARGRGARRRMPSPGSRLCRHPREPRQPAACCCRRHGRCAAALRPRDPGGARGQRPPRARPVPARCRRPRAGSRRPPGPLPARVGQSPPAPPAHLHVALRLAEPGPRGGGAGPALAALRERGGPGRCVGPRAPCRLLPSRCSGCGSAVCAGLCEMVAARRCPLLT